MAIKVEIRDFPGGRFEVMTVEHGGETFLLEDPCDEDGDDAEHVDAEDLDEDGKGAVEPSWGFKLVETSYKGRESGELIAKIQRLSSHPDAEYQSFVDEDGDRVWRVFFKRPDGPQ